MKRLIILLIILVACISTAWAARNVYSARTVALSGQILIRAEELADVTHAAVLDSTRAEEILAELRELVKEYETALIFAQSRYAGEILLGTTPPGDDTWLETLCSNPYNRPVKEILLKRTVGGASYIRINDIEVTYLTPKVPQKEVFNKSGRFRLYPDGVFRLTLPEPMRIVRIRILIEHESTGLNVFGIY